MSLGTEVIKSLTKCLLPIVIFFQPSHNGNAEGAIFIYFSLK